ncbi:hypothetical protein A2291_02315 [candidate division WOR-1 bacterium RIFOXYB2_FULL_42_35]|uniref:LPS export ABC transporter permease LptG n=1 Tax=candidate division WOR-1 bacterium RIFOXYC2_FULL_41_25 TaxID=1802586 RepID=A0A1F4TRD8_UNCSA|nr:MAG: hypothetical protein A2247_07240 [candidate division WOR-1 bacterium RIFOXYA2_FULL_41_14]OGC25397.1 MAG: hypothetical protein A2291_02315 [candidate division WOR-1 bacterium RIFOXYB2_FULL_42_35]OGC35197.1 MAG: hypothetical protein A2462_07550 [candidate division WOR-1 bacterium RIFOXYC2_FULL_41_25]OGC42985.1 MAG: hypothetical protein A2548_04805 [candidate division WOR-1 bacterium RIFOXYD2_FULL_41_8]
MKVINKYLFSEMSGPFIVGVVGFVLVMAVDLLFTMADLIINKGVPVLAVLKLLIFKMPSILVLTFPVSTLFATTMALGRLSKDSEIIALRTSGVNLFDLAKPIIFFGLVVSIIAFFTNEKIVPQANYLATKIIRQIIYKQPLPGIKENVFFKDAYNRHYYAKRVDLENKTMDNVMVYEVTEEKYPRVILANKAKVSGRIWQLEQGVIHKYDEKGFLKYEAVFSDMKLNISEDVLNFAQQKDSQEMNSKELGGMIDILEKGGGNTNRLRTDLLMKYSVPLTCFVFALIGIPFSLPSPRSGRTWGLIVTIVFMFTFYVFASVFRSLGWGGIVSPAIAAFTPQISFVIFGLLLLGWENKL